MEHCWFAFGYFLAKEETFFYKLCHQKCWLMLQETHGGKGSMQAMYRRGTHWIWDSPGPSSATGGLVTMVPRYVARESDFHFEVLIPGRVTRLSLCLHGSTIVMWNVHYHEFSGSDMNIFDRKISDDLEQAKLHPLTFSAFVVGDFNFSNKLVPPIKVHNSSGSRDMTDVATKLPAATDASTRAMDASMSGYMELLQGSPTHYWARSGTTNTIDRVFTSLHSSVVSRLYLNLHTQGDPFKLFQSRISDHVPVTLTISNKTPKLKPQLPVPPWVCRHPLYRERVQHWLRRDPFDHLSAPAHYAKHTRI